MYQVTFLHALCKTICAYSETQISKFSLQLLKMSSSKANPLSKLHLNDFLIRWGQITNLYLCVCFSLVSFIRSVYAPVKLPSDFLHCFHFQHHRWCCKTSLLKTHWKNTDDIRSYECPNDLIKTIKTVNSRARQEMQVVLNVYFARRKRRNTWFEVCFESLWWNSQPKRFEAQIMVCRI